MREREMGNHNKAAAFLSLAVTISAFSLLLPVTSRHTDDYCSSTTLPDPRTLRSDKHTILINGFSERRLPLLRTLAAAYSNLPYVAAVLILWGNPTTPSRILTQQLPFDSANSGGAAPVSVIRQPTSSLNARFLPRSEIRTRAVAICDDDIEIDAKSLAFAFSIWKTHQDRIVGFFARSHDLDLQQKTWIYTVHPDRYSIVLTKFMILRSDYLHLYTCRDGNAAIAAGMEAARGVVEEIRNCEDILMNFVVAMESGKGPMLVEGRRVRDWGDSRNEAEEGAGAEAEVEVEEEGGAKEVRNKEVRGVGLSTREGHRKRRGDCIREFHRLLGRMPLQYSYGKVVEGVREQGLCQKGGKLVFCDHFS